MLIVAGLSVHRFVSPSVHCSYVPNMCAAHNWSRILKLFHRNDYHIETMCRAQHWVATLKVKVTTWPCSKIVSSYNFVIWSLILKLFHSNDHHIETTQHLGRYLEGQGHSMTFFVTKYPFGEHQPSLTVSCCIELQAFRKKYPWPFKNYKNWLYASLLFRFYWIFHCMPYKHKLGQSTEVSSTFTSFW